MRTNRVVWWRVLLVGVVAGLVAYVLTPLVNTGDGVLSIVVRW